jgi:D-alanyl-D-alanine dipeptidase
MFGKIRSTLILLLALSLPVISQSALPETERKMISQGLVDIQKADPEILVELKYSTSDNFLKKDIYGELTRAYLQPEMARRLGNASQSLKKLKLGYKLLVYDAARPNSAQYALWDALDDLKIPAGKKTMYVADPKIGSNHNFGCAVDLTIADENGKPLDMGTRFDFFGPLAYPRSEQQMLKAGKLTARQIENRQLLRKVMIEAGFRANTTEWWHFDGMSKSQARAKYGMIK